MKDFFTLRGRLGRRDYVFFSLLPMAVMILTILCFNWWLSSVFNSGNQEVDILVITLFALVVIATMWSGSALQIRRWHDLGLSGAMVLVGLIPLVSLVAILYLIFANGNEYGNRYGEVVL